MYIEYKTGFYGVLLTVCPLYINEENQLKIGSTACQWCNHHISMNKANKTVKCSYKEDTKTC